MKISDLAESSSLANGNYLLLLDGSNNKKAKLSTLKSFLGSSMALTGTPTAPTAAAGTASTQIATTAFVNTALNARTNVSCDFKSVATEGNCVAYVKANVCYLTNLYFKVSAGSKANTVVFGTLSCKPITTTRILGTNGGTPVQFKINTDGEITLNSTTTLTAGTIIFPTTSFIVAASS